MMVAILAPILIGMAAFSVDVARWYVEGVREQKAADAAALAGVVYMPQDFATAKATALAVAARNGYTDGAGNIKVTVQPGPRTSQLQVIVQNTISNAFGVIIGVPTTTVARTGIADYSGPVPMGSPCNLFGNEALGSGELSRGSATNCTLGNRPGFWANIAGPKTSKENGDRYATQGCSSAADSFCLGAGQTDNCDHYGSSSCQGTSVIGKTVYYYRVRLAPGAGTVNVQVFDPAFINVGDNCDVNLRSGWPTSNTINPSVTDAINRYSFGNSATTPTGTGTFCTGDNQFGFTTTPPTTTYALLAPNDSGDPSKSQVVSGCAPVQFRGLNVDLTTYLTASTTQGKSADGIYAQQNFRQWITLNCQLTAPSTGYSDYYLEVRTNLTLGDASATRVLDPSDDAGENGAGHNRFALRAIASGTADAVSVSAYERMPIYANFASGTSTFYMARVPTAGYGKTLRIQLFDTGDSVQTGSIQVNLPASYRAAHPTTVLSCVDRGFLPSSTPGTTVLSPCVLTNVNASTGYQGKVKELDVRIPADYACNDSASADCWFTVSYNYPSAPSSGVTDTTTWSAAVIGDPVRLVK